MPANELDLHVRPLSEFCDVPLGVHYDIYLKFEIRAYWQPLLINYLNVSDNSVLMDTIRLHHETTKNVTVSSMLNKDTYSSSLRTLMKHYTRELFDIVCKIYQEDILRFNYTEEVKILSLLF